MFNVAVAIILTLGMISVGSSLTAPFVLERSGFVGGRGQGHVAMALLPSGVPDMNAASSGARMRAVGYIVVTTIAAVLELSAFLLLMRGSVPRFPGSGPCGLLPLGSTLPATAAVLAIPLGPFLPLLPPVAQALVAVVLLGLGALSAWQSSQAPGWEVVRVRARGLRQEAQRLAGALQLGPRKG